MGSEMCIRDRANSGNEQRWLLKFDQCEFLAVVNVALDLHVEFLKLASLRDFKTSSRAVKKL